MPLTILCFCISMVGVLLGCPWAHAQSTATSIDGSCMELAILVDGNAQYDKCENIFCVAGEYKKNRDQEFGYINKKFGEQNKDWEFISKQMREEYNRTYDLITIKIKATGEEREVYFNITEPRLQSEEALQKLKDKKR